MDLVQSNLMDWKMVENCMDMAEMLLALETLALLQLQHMVVYAVEMIQLEILLILLEAMRPKMDIMALRIQTRKRAQIR